jgi:hypothetical protein
MKRITLNAWIDIGCLITFIPSLITGLVLYLIIPEGSGRGAGFLGILRTQWVSLHNYSSLAFAVLLIIHLLLHGKFFKNIGNCFSAGDKKSCDTE